MKNKLLIPVLLLSLIIVIPSCSQSDEIAEFDCSNIAPKDCVGSPTLDICFKCEICSDNENTKDASIVRVWLETTNDRTSSIIGYFDLDNNFNFKGSVCGKLLEGVPDQVIGFELMTVDSVKLDYISFDKVTLSENSTTYIDKTVLEFGSNCNGRPVEIFYNRDPETVITESVSFSICLIGSLGDCVEAYYYTADVDWQDEENYARDFLIETLTDYPFSTPCEGVYINIRE